MKEKIITKIIPETHRNIALFLFLLFLLGFFTFVALLEGIRIDHLRISGVTVEKLYLKWDHALHIKAEKIDLSALKSDDTPLTLKPLSKLSPIMRRVEAWVDTISINIIKYDKLRVSLFYVKDHPGVIRIKYRDIESEGKFTLNENVLHLSIPQVTINQGSISGDIRAQLKNETLTSRITIVLPQTPLLRLKVSGDSERLLFSLNSDGPFSSIRPLIDFFSLDPAISPWIVDYAKFSSLQLNRMTGSFSYDTPHELINTLKADASVEGGEYTFAQGIEPIRSPKVALTFKEGKLFINPVYGTFYGMPTEKSHLFIDFTSPHTMLSAFILTSHAMLNDPILNLLRHYRIDLPIKQMKGECNVDLNLSINLHDLNTTAKGVFIPTPSEIVLDQIPLRTEGGKVVLDGKNVHFDNFTAHYGDSIGDAFVNGYFDASEKKGSVTIDAFNLSPTGDKNQLSLFDTHKPLRIAYLINPWGDSLNVSPSTWNLLGKKLNIGAFKAPFDYHNARTSIESASFTIDDSIRGTFHGDFDGTAKKTIFHVDLNHFDIKDLTLTNTPFQVDLEYNNELMNFTFKNASAWTIHQLPVLISPFSASMRGNEITFNHVETVLDDILKGDFSGSYNLASNKGLIRLGNISPLKPKITPYIDTKESIDFSVNTSEDKIILDAPSLKARFITIPKGWKISLLDMSLLSQKSPLLRRYHIDNGYLDILYTGGHSLYNFSGEINYPYSLILINDKPINRYRYSGTYNDGHSIIRVNNRVNIDHIGNDTSIKAINVGINMPELFNFLSSQSSIDKEITVKKDTQSINILATHTYLYLMEGRKIIADTLNASLYDENFDATLEHMGGHANLKIRHGLFSINGTDFNDRFMDHLFALSDFSGGKFSFEAKGQMDAFDGIMRVENTILKDYKVLNNVLAFINTIPSLATFSLPNYHTKGLPVNEGYAHFAYEKGKLNVDNFTLNSREIKLMGETRADMNTKTLNGTLTLKTDLGSKLSKVPMVGYILFGKDGSISTTVTISGNIEDPKVETAIAKEIATAPFNILKRTLVYPFLWMIDDEK